MNKNDLRYIKTEKLIVDIFINCIEEVGFEDTTVSMICEKALISRNTFYVHYEDKYALLKSLLDSFEKRTVEKFRERELNSLKNNTYCDACQWAMDCIYENKKLVKALIKSSRKDFEIVFNRIFADSILSLAHNTYHSKKDELNAKLIQAFMMTASIGFFEKMLEENVSLPNEQIYDLFVRLVAPGSELFKNYM